MPPVLEITPEMVGPARTEMTLAYLNSVMIWPDDHQWRREVMKTAHALQMRETLRTVPASRDAIALEAVEASLYAKRPEDLVKESGDRYYRGCQTGEFVLNAVLANEMNPPAKLDAIKSALTLPERRMAHPMGNISRSMLDNKIIPRFRPVAHLWAAHVWEVWESRQFAEKPWKTGFPCLLERVPWFLLAAEVFRRHAIAFKYPRRPGRRHDTLLPADQAWTLPPGLPLPVDLSTPP